MFPSLYRIVYVPVNGFLPLEILDEVLKIGNLYGILSLCQKQDGFTGTYTFL